MLATETYPVIPPDPTDAALSPSRRNEAAFLSLHEAVQLGYGGYSTLRARIASGRLPAHRIGRMYRVRREDLEILRAPTPMPHTERLNADSETIRRLVAAAPRLTAEQREQLAAILGGGA